MTQQYSWEDVHAFWFGGDIAAMDQDALMAQFQWWNRGGAAAELPRFRPVVDAARAGQLDHWAATPLGRLSLIVVLDQFTRTLFAEMPDAYASDPAALRLAEEGIASGHHARIATPWELTFYELPLSHAEGPRHLDRLDFVIAAAGERLAAAPPSRRRMAEFAASQPKAARDVIARFGRYPHRNAILGRSSTPAELDFLAEGDLVHLRSPQA